MLKNYDVFLFDFDGTLFDTLESSIYVFEEAYRRIGVTINREDILGYTREPIPVSYEKLMGSLDGYGEFIKDIDRLVFSQKVVDMTEIYEDTKRVIEALKKHNKIVGIVTSNSKLHVIDILKKFDMENDFDVIVGNKEASTPKPSPIPILTAIETLNLTCPKERIAYIGDAINDAIAATNAKVKPILLDRLNEFSYLDYELIHNLDELVE